MCADHNDTGGGAEHRHPGSDPADGGRITPICDLGDSDASSVREGLEMLHNAGAHVLHYTHTRVSGKLQRKKGSGGCGGDAAVVVPHHAKDGRC